MSILPTGTVTFLFTDIEGSTRLLHQLRDRYATVLDDQRRLLRIAFNQWNGHEVDTEGDAFFVAFARAADALRAAVDAQRALAAHPWTDGVTVRVRMGLHTGEPTLGPTGYVGLDVHRAARIASAGHGGQVLLSDTTRALIENDLPEGVMLRDLGKHRLKDLRRAEPISQLLISGLPADFPPLKSLDALPNNLPIQLTSFIGREQELAQVKRLLETARLVTLTGSGGTGKTRIALQEGAELLDSFADGVWVVELARVSNPELVPLAVATVVGVREVAGHPLLVALQDALRTKSLLLILDNCEHLIGASAQLADTLLHACPTIKILTTSREALGIAGESTFRVPSLALPDPQHLPAPDRLTQFDAVRLFIDRAVLGKSDFQVTNANAPAVAQLCHRLDGIPLAIELAAARVKGLSVEQIAARLDDRFRLLTGGSRTALPRQQTLRTSVDWSYDLLSEDERSALRRLSVFVGDWTLEAAEAVVGLDGIVSGDVLDLLLRLVDKSLVVAEELGGETRYRLLETIRQYAREKLLDSGEAQHTRAHHLDFFLSFAEQAESQLHSVERLIWLERKQSEYGNLRAALEWAREASTTESTPLPNATLRLARATEQLADVQSLLGAGSQAIPLYQAALEFWQDIASADKRIALRLHGKIVQTVTDLTWRIEFDRFQAMSEIAARSRAYLETVLPYIKAQAPHPELVRILTALSEDACIVKMPRDWHKAEEYARAAVDMGEKLDAPVELSTALFALAQAYHGLGLAREYLQVTLRRLALSRDPHFGDMQERISAVMEAGFALLNVGDYDQVMPYLAEASSLAKQIQAIILERWTLEVRTYCLFRLDRWDEMFDVDEQLRDIRQRYPLERIGPTCTSIALVAAAHALRGESDLAAAQRAEAHRIMTTVAGSEQDWSRAQHY